MEYLQAVAAGVIPAAQVAYDEPSAQYDDHSRGTNNNYHRSEGQARLFFLCEHEPSFGSSRSLHTDDAFSSSTFRTWATSLRTAPPRACSPRPAGECRAFAPFLGTHTCHAQTCSVCSDLLHLGLTTLLRVSAGSHSWGTCLETARHQSELRLRRCSSIASSMRRHRMHRRRSTTGRRCRWLSSSLPS